jgi:hypothetical protein
LDVKVNDPSFRQQNLAERHLEVLSGSPRGELVEWEERINLLAKELESLD